MYRGVLLNQSKEVYFDNIWDESDGGGPKLDILGKILCRKENQRSFSDSEISIYYNNFIVPIWNFVYEKKATLIIDGNDKEQFLVKTKGDLIDLMWLLTNCWNIEELDFGITALPKEKKTKKVKIK